MGLNVRQLTQKAASYYQDKKARWTTDVWLAELDEQGSEFNPLHVNDTTTIGGVRRWLRERRFGAANGSSCAACLEGALMVALAEDGSIPDDARARDLLKEFQGSILNSAQQLGYIEDDLDQGIPDLNDSYLDDESQALAVLLQASKS